MGSIDEFLTQIHEATNFNASIVKPPKPELELSDELLHRMNNANQHAQHMLMIADLLHTASSWRIRCFELEKKLQQLPLRDRSSTALQPREMRARGATVHERVHDKHAEKQQLLKNMTDLMKQVNALEKELTQLKLNEKPPLPSTMLELINALKAGKLTKEQFIRNVDKITETPKKITEPLSPPPSPTTVPINALLAEIRIAGGKTLKKSPIEQQPSTKLTKSLSKVRDIRETLREAIQKQRNAILSDETEDASEW
jgi:hypothetical protein